MKLRYFTECEPHRYLLAKDLFISTVCDSEYDVILCHFLICFVKLHPYYESNLASSRSSRTPACLSNPTQAATAQTHASTSQDSSWANNLLGFCNKGHKTQCNSLESEVETYLSDFQIGVNSMTFWQVSDSESDLILY